MARLNAESVRKTEQQKDIDTDTLTNELKERLHLTNEPSVMECYDISNWGGKLAVGSMVQFRDGKPAETSIKYFLVGCK